MVSLRFAQRLHAVFAPDFKVARVVEAHLPVFLFGTGLDKWPFGGYLSVARSKASGADAGIGRTDEFLEVPLVERDLHQKVERQGCGDDPALDNRRPQGGPPGAAHGLGVGPGSRSSGGGIQRRGGLANGATSQARRGPDGPTYAGYEWHRGHR